MNLNPSEEVKSAVDQKMLSAADSTHEDVSTTKNFARAADTEEAWRQLK